MAYIYDTGSIQLALTKTQVLSASNTSATHNLFKITGSVLVKRLYGRLTAKTTLANMTSVYFAIYDGSATNAITKNDGVMSTAVVGAIIVKNAVATTTAGINLAATGTISESGDEGVQAFIVTQKLSTNTYIRFLYSTTDAPIACTMKFYVEYESIDGGYLTAV